MTSRNSYVATKDLLYVPGNDDEIHHAIGAAENGERSTHPPANE